jgi:hypothetical protein
LDPKPDEATDADQRREQDAEEQGGTPMALMRGGAHQVFLPLVGSGDR